MITVASMDIVRPRSDEATRMTQYGAKSWPNDLKTFQDIFHLMNCGFKYSRTWVYTPYWFKTSLKTSPRRHSLSSWQNCCLIRNAASRVLRLIKAWVKNDFRLQCPPSKVRGIRVDCASNHSYLESRSRISWTVSAILKCRLCIGFSHLRWWIRQFWEDIKRR